MDSSSVIDIVLLCFPCLSLPTFQYPAILSVCLFCFFEYTFLCCPESGFCRDIQQLLVTMTHRGIKTERIVFVEQMVYYSLNNFFKWNFENKVVHFPFEQKKLAGKNKDLL